MARANNFFSPSAHVAGTKWRSFNLRIVNVIRTGTKADEGPRSRRDGGFKVGVNFVGVKEVPNFLNHRIESDPLSRRCNGTRILAISLFGRFGSIRIESRDREYPAIITASGERRQCFKLSRAADERIGRIARFAEKRLVYRRAFQNSGILFLFSDQFEDPRGSRAGTLLAR